MQCNVTMSCKHTQSATTPTENWRKSTASTVQPHHYHHQDSLAVGELSTSQSFDNDIVPVVSNKNHTHDGRCSYTVRKKLSRWNTTKMDTITKESS